MDFIELQEMKKQLVKKNKKKLILSVIIVVIIVIIVLLISCYIANKTFRDMFDKYILQKNVTENNVTSIEINPDLNQYVYAYDKHITVLEQNTLSCYNSSGKKESEMKIEISNPVFKSNNQFLLVAEKDKQKLYFISGTNVVWEKEVEGIISKMNINRNGYVSLIITGTTHKSVIIVYTPSGKELFKIYLSSTIAIDSDISSDNKYLSFAEVNTSGTLIQSNIKTVSVEKATDSPSEAIVYTYEAPTNSLILNLKYQDKKRLICMYNDSIHCIQEEEDEELIKLEEKNVKVSFAGIELENYTYRIVENSTGLFRTESVVEFISATNKRENMYTTEGVAKQVYSNSNVIAVNFGSEVHFVNTNGWLVKQYTSTQEIRNIVMGMSIAGIVYRDKIEIINW